MRENPFMAFEHHIQRAKAAAEEGSHSSAQSHAQIAGAYAQMAAAHNLQSVQQALQNR